SISIAKSCKAKVVESPVNLGFGAACNLGAKILSTSHVLFLNPDAVLENGAVDELNKAIDRFPDAGGFAPSVHIIGTSRSFRSKSYIQDQGSRYIEDSLVPSTYTEVDFIDGAAMVCDRNLFLAMEGFDETLFLYYEDDDLSYRIRSANK